MREGWYQTKLSSVCDKNSNIKWQTNLNKNFEYIDLSSVCRKSLSVTETSTINSGNAPSRAKKIVKKDDVIFATTRPTLKRVTVINEDYHNQICSTGFSVLRPKVGFINSRFIYYFLQTEVFMKRMERLQRGASYPAVSEMDVMRTSIYLPKTYEEQQQIVSILDEAFEAIDQAIANIEKNIANAQELFQSKLNEIFSQRGEGWEEKTLGDICLNLDSKRVPITKSKRTPGDIPYYGASGIVDYVADYLFDEDLLLISEDGANLLARTYPIAFSISGKTWVNNHAHVLKFNEMTSQKFIEYYLNSIRLDDYISGMAQPKLNQRMLNSIPIPFPPLLEQERVLDVISTLDSEIEDLDKLYSTKLVGLKELKKSILQKAFAGELTNQEVESLQLAAEPGEHY